MEAEAVVFVAKNRVEFKRIEIPDPKPQEVVVRTRFSWISNGTESSYLRGDRSNGETPFRRGDPAVFPRVPGYQKTGTVEWVGSAVEGLRLGDWVFVAGSRVCHGVSQMGGHVSIAVVPHESVWKLPEGLDPIAASGLVLTQVGYNCGSRPPVNPGDFTVVMGDGLVGHWAAQALAWRGARVAMVGRHNFRLKRLHLEEAITVNSRREDPVKVIQKWHEGVSDGIAALVDTVGSIPTLYIFLPLMRPQGYICSAGFYGAEGKIDIQKLRRGEQTLHCLSGYTRERIDQTLQLLASGELDTTSLITHRFPAREVKVAWDLIRDRQEDFLGIVLEWN